MRVEAKARPDFAQAVASRRRFQISMAFFSFIVIGLNDAGLGILLPSIRAHYGISTGTAGLLFPAGSLGYLTAALSSGLLLERLGRRAFFLLGATAFSIGALLVFTMPVFPLLLASLLCVGFGVAVLDAGLNAYIAGLPRSTGLLNYLHAFYGIGALLGPVVASTILALAWGWNTTYLVWMGAGLLVLAGFGLLFERRDTAQMASAAGTESGNVFTATLRSRIAWVCALFLFVYVGTEVSLGSWSYSLLTQERHQAVLLASWMVSGYWLGLTVGRVALGHVAERVGSQRLIIGCLGGVLAGVLLVWWAPAGVVAACGLWLTGFALGPIFPTTIAVVNGLVSQRLQQSAIGFAAGLGSMGSAVFPWLAGNLVQRAGLWSLLPYAALLALVMLAFWLLLRRLAGPHPAAARP
jgi:fucose permease